MRLDQPAGAPVETFAECSRVRDIGGCGWTYRRSDGKPLARGYYVVTWPRTPMAGRRVRDLVFEGPFGWREAAKCALHTRPKAALGTAFVAWWAGGEEAARAERPGLDGVRRQEEVMS